MRKVIIAAVAALAIAPFTASIPLAHADDPCLQYTTNPADAPKLGYCESHRVLGCDACGVPGVPAAAPAAPAVPPANVPNDNCAVLLQPPNASVGAYNGCEVANQATGR
jgi:hypothetical protein